MKEEQMFNRVDQSEKRNKCHVLTLYKLQQEVINLEKAPYFKISLSLTRSPFRSALNAYRLHINLDVRVSL